VVVGLRQEAQVVEEAAMLRQVAQGAPVPLEVVVAMQRHKARAAMRDWDHLAQHLLEICGVSRARRW
jgi:hypothetical protein